MRNAVVIAVILCFAGPAWGASQAADLLPAETDVVVTLNPREALRDCREIASVQRYLDQWRLAAKGDEKPLLKYYETQEIHKYEGISRTQFLQRSEMIKTACAAFRGDPFEDIDSITVGYAAGDKGFLAIIIEGRFPQPNMLRLEQFLNEQGVPVNKGDGSALARIDTKTVVFADSKNAMEAIHARAGKRTGALPTGVRALIESGRKKHLSVVVTKLGTNGQRLMTFVGEELAGPIGIDPAISKVIVEQGTNWLKTNATDYVAASIGITVRSNQLRLELGIDAKTAEKAAALRQLIDTGTFLGALALKAIDHDMARQLAGILARQRVVLEDTSLIVSIDVPYEFLDQLVQDPLFDVFPELHKPKPNIKPFPGLDDLRKMARQGASTPLWKPGALTAVIEEVREVAYRAGPGTDPLRHRLDMFLPKNTKDFPIVVLVHGGGWDTGDNRSAGLYSSVGQFLASQGIGVVLPNYRLSPAVRHPEHIKDVAQAVAWARSNVGKYGGDPQRLFLMGHSAGGHLVSLLAADESYLKGEGMKSADIQGVISFSGVYRIPDGLMHGALGGSGPRSLRIEHMWPLRGESGPSWKWQPPGVPVAVDIFGPAFGDSEKHRAAASPMAHVRRDMPRFLILTPEHELPTLVPMANEFHAALRDKGCDSRLVRVPRRNHNSLMFSAITPQDPAAQAVVDFVRK